MSILLKEQKGRNPETIHIMMMMMMMMMLMIPQTPYLADLAEQSLIAKKTIYKAEKKKKSFTEEKTQRGSKNR